MSCYAIITNILLTFVICFSITAKTLASADKTAVLHPQHIFILHSYHQEYPWTKKQNEGFVGSLSDQNNYIISTEYLDTKRIAFDAKYQEFFADYLQKKYDNYSPDIVFCTDDNALSFLRYFKPILFPQSPVVFSGVNNLDIEQDLDRSQYTGVLEHKEIALNIELLRKILPQSSEIIFLGDNSSTHQAIKQNIKEVISEKFPDIPYSFIENSHLSYLVDALERKNKGIVFLTTIGGVLDNQGSVLPLPEIISSFAGAGEFTIISMEDAYLEEGVLGGYVTNGFFQGKAAALLANKILRGFFPASMPLTKDNQNVYMFNYPELKRKSIAVSQLPPESIILNQPQTFYEQYKYQIISALFLVLLQTIVIVILMMNINQRRRAQRGLKEARDELEQKVKDRTAELEKELTLRHEVEKERGKLLAERLHAQKLESVGRLAAGIAHEINTPAQYIGSNIQFMQEAFEDTRRLVAKLLELLEAAKEEVVSSMLVEDIERLLEEVDWEYLSEEIPQTIEQSQDGVKRVTSIVLAMKEFSHPGGKEKTPANLNRIIETTVTVARNEWNYVASVETDLDSDLPPVPVLTDEIGQVILNLLVNATHAIASKVGENGEGGKGVISIATACHDGWAEVRIADSGTGIPEEARERIFDPFFTTKSVGKGTGQGLAIAYDVVTQKHRGTLAFETEQGKGTTFIIRLPLND